jgi:hypothetical protein
MVFQNLPRQVGKATSADIPRLAEIRAAVHALKVPSAGPAMTGKAARPRAIN